MNDFNCKNMLAQIIDGKKIAANIHKNSAKQIAKLKKQGLKPKLGVILVGHDKPSETYVGKKEIMAQNIGLDFELYRFPTSISQIALIKKIKNIQTDKNLCGLIVQLPLPKKFQNQAVLNAVNPKIDVDCLTSTNQKKLSLPNPIIIPPTPKAILEVLKQTKISLKNKTVTILGQGILVGKPLSKILKNLPLKKLYLCDHTTKNNTAKCLASDIVISGVGKINLIRGNMVKPGAVVIDAGTSVKNKKVFGDANQKEMKTNAGFFTPTPGGIGPITVACLLANAALLAQNKK